MPGFRNIKAYVDALNNGQTSTSSLRKVPSNASTAGQWVDLSGAAGNPRPNYFATSPITAAVLDQYDGIYHGGNRAPFTTHLAEIMLVTPTAALVGRYKLLDYVLYYPFVDLDDADPQTMTNAVTLPRYADGVGVLPMLVAAQPTVGGGSFSFNYVNQDGVTKTAPTQSCGPVSTTIGSIVTSQPGTQGAGPFLALASGDSGVRSIVSWTNVVPNGGLGTLVLVQPIADHAVLEVNTPAERSCVTAIAGAPRIFDGAYLHMIVNCAGSVAAGTLTGRLDFAWN